MGKFRIRIVHLRH